MTRMLGGLSIPVPSNPDPGPVHPTLQAIRDMAPNSWLGLPNTNPSAITPSPVPPGDGPDRSISAYSGGFFLEAAGGEPDRLGFWGGGHTGYAGNEVYGFRLDTFVWELLIGATPTGQITTNTETYTDGNPSSRHTEAMLSGDNDGNFICAYGSGVWGDGQTAGVAIWRFNIASRTWTNLDQTYAGGGQQISSAAIVHPTTGDIWHLRYGFVGQLSQFVIGTGWTYHGNGTATSALGQMAIQPTTNLLCVQSNNGLYIWNLNTPAVAPTQPTITGDSSLVNGYSGGHEYCSVDGKIYCWDGGGTMDRYTPNQAAITMERATNPTGDPAPTTQVNGTHGRFQYWEAEDRFVTINDYNGNVCFYRRAV